MKLVASNPFLSQLTVLAALFAAPLAHATDGTWVGNSNWWSDPASWVGGTVPNGTDGTANFTGVNITGSINKPLGGAGDNRTIGNIIFTDATTSSHDLTLSGNTLTLDVTSGQPNIDVTQSGRTLTISSVVAGNDGFQKSGLGNLTLTGANTLTGNILVSAGTLQVNRVDGTANPTATALGNTQTLGRTATISSGGTLNFMSGDVMGNGGSSPKLTIIANGGTIRNNTGANFFNVLGPVELNGGTLSSFGGGSADYPSFALTGGVTVGGSAVSTISTSGTNSHIGLSGAGTTFNVADAVSGSGSDLNVTGVLANWGGGSGSLIKTGAGTMTLSGTNTYTGTTTVSAGTLLTTQATALSGYTTSAKVVFNGGTVGVRVGGAGWTTGQVDTLLTNATKTSGALGIDTTNGGLTQWTAFTTTNFGSSLGLTKLGSNTLTLNQTNTYTGATTISQGTLALGASGSIASSSTVIVGASTTFDVSAVSGGYTLGGTQTLSGSGTVVGAMTVSGTLSPGNSPGFLPTGSQTWVNGGDYNFQMLNATGLAGTGFDQIQITGTLDLTSLTANGFNLNLWSLSSTGPDVNGNALNFNNAINQSWTILTTTGGISGFEVADFTVNVGAINGTNGFLNPLGGGSFSIDATSNNLILNYTAIPEPNVAALFGSLGALALLRRRRN